MERCGDPALFTLPWVRAFSDEAQKGVTEGVDVQRKTAAKRV